MGVWVLYGGSKEGPYVAATEKQNIKCHCWLVKIFSSVGCFYIFVFVLIVMVAIHAKGNLPGN